MSELIGKRVNVLDKGWIELQDMMGDDNAIVSAARTSFLGESKGAEQDKKLLFYLLRNKHSTPFEQVVFRFRLRAPVITWWQLLRHRTFRPNLQSGRYTEFEENDFYVVHGDGWRLQSRDNKQASYGLLDEGEGTWLSASLVMHYDAGYRLYEEAIKRGVAREQARLFLSGFALYYTGVVQADAHNLMHFLKLRTAIEAQYEIRVYAEAIFEHFFQPALPWTAEAFEMYELKAY